MAKSKLVEVTGCHRGALAQRSARCYSWQTSHCGTQVAHVQASAKWIAALATAAPPDPYSADPRGALAARLVDPPRAACAEKVPDAADQARASRNFEKFIDEMVARLAGDEAKPSDEPAIEKLRRMH